MSQGEKPNQAANPTTDGVVDIDQLEVEVLIICKNPTAFQQTATFLSRRGWPTTVMGNLSKAIDYIVKNTPDIVMISCNHPNPGTMRLPSLLKHIKTNCIGFAESGDATSSAKLVNMAFKHKLQGLASGPNVQRMIRKILMDIYNPTLAKTNEESGDSFSGSGSDKTTISGSGKNDHGNTISIKGSGPNSVGPSERIGNDENEESLDVGNYRMGRQKERKRLKDLAPHEVETSAPSEDKDVQVDRQALLALAQESEGAITRNESKSYTPPPSLQVHTGLEAKDLGSAMQEGHGSGEEKSAVQAGNGNISSQSVLEEGKGSAIQTSTPPLTSESAQELDQKTKVTAVKFFAPQHTDVATSKTQELFEKSVEVALERSCKPEGNPLSLSTVETVGILPVDASDLHGYLVLSAAQVAPEKQMEFLISFRSELCALLAEYGLNAKVEEGFVLLQEPFNFLDWAKQEAELCLMAQHKNCEIAISFFPTEERFTEPRESEKADMAMISVKEINTDQPIPFKAYLHFKQSDRFYLYLRNGRRLYKKQKDRLLEHKVANFYIKSVDIKNYRTYSAANFISNSLRRFKRPLAS